MFDKNSVLVKVWVRLIRSGSFAKEQVPDIGNLKEIVGQVMENED